MTLIVVKENQTLDPKAFIAILKNIELISWLIYLLFLTNTLWDLVFFWII